MSGSVEKLFPEELDDVEAGISLNFQSETIVEEMETLQNTLSAEAFKVLKLAQAIYNSCQLHEILGNEQYISFAKVQSYQAHKNDKYMLKKVLQKYDRKAYRAMFYKSTPASYSGYINQNRTNKKNKQRRLFSESKDQAKRTKELFYKNVLSVLDEEALPEKAANDPMIHTIRERIANDTFMPKQRTKDNALVPNQLYAQEVKIILDNASTYLPFLNEVDAESKLSVKERLLQLFSFTIPYYVGPVIDPNLHQDSRFAWSTYRPGESGAIYPWNLEKKVDTKQSAKAFINSLIGQCTYLPAKKVLPKASLLYETYMVLNELNSIKIRGKKISVEAKQSLYNDLFLAGKKVSHAKLTKHLITIGEITKEDLADLTYSGSYSNGPTVCLSSLGKFQKLFDAGFIENHEDMIEDIIFLSTVFGSDSKDFLEEELKAKYGDVLSEEQIGQILGMSFIGWGNFAKEFLTLKGYSEANERERDFGEKSLIDMMWLTNNTLQELLFGKYSYKDQIEKYNQNITGVALKDWNIEDLNAQYIHVSLRKILWQTRAIILDVERLMGYSPEKIFVQRAKGGQPPKKTNRKKELLAIYKKIKDPTRDWVEEIEALSEADFRVRNRYLYYLQMGRCLYTGQAIAKEDIFSDAYSRDHIYPKSKTYDNSLDNLALVVADHNREKSDEYPLDSEIQENMKDFWKLLLDRGLLTKEKYSRLTRTTPLTDDELAGYIDYQMKDSRPGTKTAYKLLKDAYKGNDTEVILTKSTLVSEFRNIHKLQEPTIVSDLYHAHNAYLGIVAGNVYNAKFSADSHLYLYKNKDKKHNYNLYRMYDKDVTEGSLVVWKAEDEEKGTCGTISSVTHTVMRPTPLLTKMPVHADGILFDLSIRSKDIAGKNAANYVRLKKDLPVEKYGGRTKVKAEYYALCDYTIVSRKERNTVRALIPVLTMWQVKEHEEERLAALIANVLNSEVKGNKHIEDVRVVEYPILQQSKLRVNGFDYWLGGKSSNGVYARPAISFFIPADLGVYVKKLEKAQAQKSYAEVDNNGVPILTQEKNSAVYEYIIAKLHTPIFQKMVKNIVLLLEAGREAFTELPLEKQCAMLVDLCMWLSGRKQALNLSEIGGTAHDGVMSVPANLSKVNEAYIIKESATGLSSRRVSLL